MELHLTYRETLESKNLVKLMSWTMYEHLYFDPIMLSLVFPVGFL